MKGIDEKKYYKHHKNIKLGRTFWVHVLYIFFLSVDLITNDHDITY